MATLESHKGMIVRNPSWLSGAILLISMVIMSCKASSWSRTNRIYREQSKSMARVLSDYPLQDSAGLPYAQEFVGTTNFGLRKPNAVIIHHTAQGSCDQTLRTFTNQRTAVSAHYVICEDGTVHHMLHDLLRAHHAGVSKWGSFSDINSSSIGIEIDNDGFEPFTELQVQSLLQLLGRLKRAYQIPTANFVGHADIAPGRKVDPNRHFPWQRLAQEGYGYWYDTTNVKVPPGFDPMMALRIIGYNVNKPQSAIQSYKLHFHPTDSTAAMTPTDLKILYSLQEQYR